MPKALLPVTKASFRYHIFFFRFKEIDFFLPAKSSSGKNNL